MRYTARLEDFCTDSDAVRHVSDYYRRNVGSFGHTLINRAFPDDETLDAAAATERLLESASLVEAVATLPVFVCVIASHDGVPVLLRSLMAFASMHLISEGSDVFKRGLQNIVARVNEAQASAQAAMSSISLPLADRALSRMCNTLAHLAHVTYEVAGGLISADAEDEPIDLVPCGIDEKVRKLERMPTMMPFGDVCSGRSRQMHMGDTLALIVRAMRARARPELRAFATATLALVSRLALGTSHLETCDHIDGIVAVQVRLSAI